MTKRNRKQMSYEGKDIFVGLDVHKKTYAVVARVDGVIAKRWTTVADPQKLADQLLKYFQGGRIHTAYEAGFSGLALHRMLTEQGISNLVVHAAGVEVAVSDRVKTDKRDAAKLASLLESNRLKGIRILTEEEENHRQLSRTRQQLVQERTSVKNRIRMKFHQLGVIAADENKAMSHLWVKKLLGRLSSPEFILAIEAYSHVWKTLDEEIAKLEKALKQQAKADPNESTYRSAPGIGPLSARILSNELGDMSQFQNERQLFSYTGLTPSEYSSGENIRKGHITRQGNSRVRAILVEVAWRAIGEDPALATCFDRLFPHTGKKRAIIAVARKLIGKIRAAFQQGELYQINYQASPKLAA